MTSAAPGSPSVGLALRAAGALAAREVRRFVRQPSRVVGSLATPALVWAFMAAGFAGSMGQGAEYPRFLLAGMASMTVLMSSIFGAMSLIDDRHAGFLQGVLTSPAPRWSAALAKLAGGAALAWAQGAILIPASWVLGAPFTVTGLVQALAALAVIAVFVSALGLALAWVVDSSQGFHGVMNLILMPMWLLSGSLFPVGEASSVVRPLMVANPLTWPTSLLREALGAGAIDLPGGAPAAWAISLAAAGLAWLATFTVFGRIR